MALIMGWSTTLTRRGSTFEAVCWIGLGALGILAFRLAHVSLYLDAGAERAWALARDLRPAAEFARAVAISVRFALGCRWVAGHPSFSQSSRVLLPLVLPLLGVIALAGVYLPVPSVLTA